MPTDIPEKLFRVAADIGAQGSVHLMRLTVLKKWLARPERLAAFAIWIATRSVLPKGKASGGAAKFNLEARLLLAGADEFEPKFNRRAAQSLHKRLADFQSEYQNQQWGRVRIVRHWNLMLIEQALAIYLWHRDSPALGYKLAADYCRHYDSRFFNALNGPSRQKIEALVRFLITYEAFEDSGPGF